MNKATDDEFEAYLESINFKQGFWGGHYGRYVETWNALHRALTEVKDARRALEVGTSWVFATYLKVRGLLQEVDVTDFNEDYMGRARLTRGGYPEFDQLFTAFSVNLESDLLPVDDGVYDLVLCGEVIEHMDVDPMFMMAEINRCMRIGGVLILTTPNSISSQIVGRVLNGYSPQHYMLYQKDRSPYRHNFEYAPHQMRQLVQSAGFEVFDLWTADVLNAADGPALEVLAQHGYPASDRGDNMFCICRKTGPIVERYPNEIYDVSF